jgi:hypothetical protein
MPAFKAWLKICKCCNTVHQAMHEFCSRLTTLYRNLVGYRFNWASSIFYIVYLTVEVPSNIILKRVGPRFYRERSLILIC